MLKQKQTILESYINKDGERCLKFSNLRCNKNKTLRSNSLVPNNSRTSPTKKGKLLLGSRWVC